MHNFNPKLNGFSKSLLGRFIEKLRTKVFESRLSQFDNEIRERARQTIQCRDCDYIPKVECAGEVNYTIKIHHIKLCTMVLRLF